MQGILFDTSVPVWLASAAKTRSYSVLEGPKPSGGHDGSFLEGFGGLQLNFEDMGLAYPCGIALRDH
ncbi:MAG: hypothetical protein GX124_07085 [Clostridiales bacterium]|jgi:hypothetical protein|nr:hypothetical protein [Clostridiales bacterium]